MDLIGVFILEAGALRAFGTSNFPNFLTPKPLIS